MLKTRNWLISALDEDNRKAGVATVRRSIYLAHAIGANVVILHPVPPDLDSPRKPRSTTGVEIVTTAIHERRVNLADDLSCSNWILWPRIGRVEERGVDLPEQHLRLTIE